MDEKVASSFLASRRAILTLTAAMTTMGLAESPCRATSRKPSGSGSAEPDSLIVYRDVLMPMRDGVRLATDIYFPARSGMPIAERFPVVLIRTPYNKAISAEPMGAFALAGRGYAVALQDKRGCYASEGRHVLLNDDSDGRHRDGYDSVEWLARQPWSNGEVGTWGPSYLGYTCMGAAVSRPPSLVAALSSRPSTDMFTDQCFVDGVLTMLVARFAIAAGDDLVAHMPVAEQKAAAHELAEARMAGVRGLMATPLSQLPFARLVPDFWGNPLKNRDNPEFFAENRFDEAKLRKVDIPILHLGGWFDHFIRNTIRHFSLVRELAETKRVREAQRLVIGPWGHSSSKDERFGEVDFPGAAVDDHSLLADWMDQWTEGRDPDRSPVSPVLVYVMGANRWRFEEFWPPKDAIETTFYLREGRQLSSAPPGQELPDRFQYDPANPYVAPRAIEGMRDLTQYQLGTNVLIFTSEPVREPMEIAGSIEVTLFAASSSTDTDWVVEIHDVLPDSRSMIFTEGICRARYRDSRTKPSPITPAEVYRYELVLRPISLVLQPGHRLRVVITSGKFPAFERHPNAYIDLNEWTEADVIVAAQTVFHDHSRPSCVRVPILDPRTRDMKWTGSPAPLVPDKIAPPLTERPGNSLEGSRSAL